MRETRMKSVVVYSLLLLFSLLFLAPFYWMITTAVKTPEELYLFPPKWIPSVFQWDNFAKAWQSQPFDTYLNNSLIVTGLSLIGQLLSSSLVAYGFARFHFRGKDALFLILLASMMIPWEVTMIPLYMEFNALGWINTLKPLIVPAWFGSPFFIFLLRQFIMGIPTELEEAARIDGANPVQIFLRLIVPLLRPALILVGVFHILSSWNDYLGPLIFLNDQTKYTLTLGLSQFRGMFGVDMVSIMAVTFLICLPPLAAFFLAQRYIVEGIVTTGIKG
ncbi:carbohydrate ABC transporter permease [Paenibacillus melissococcoides]|uniref:Carbohydrate ABC transporter permease n=1 Tax=Paenibacillus melissococcoides TaxID=2912268 RepID=A0ABM9G621_9BACL|nr:MULTISPECIES: carbohydrate ABC transporter permease [Paenibacillus]MEB9896072.1 carbohydrate ABC transporter permease [Bacillus cereus]CAH8247318.1 carbohydrate ABC transporter permease [Paenibacillus melissococcoides]CAH8717354.1 carbohydrate ABC transporter permease [Paenibacillus melissococcoides]CAH8718341.1 carbohydrate ABC transporter permease [Paenibacillus melissococcoides]GIO77883.1 sn-glycerol-3-phosphate transport system permease protein UgpE [Paenibacillus dendritiformis]